MSGPLPILPYIKWGFVSIISVLSIMTLGVVGYAVYRATRIAYRRVVLGSEAGRMPSLTRADLSLWAAHLALLPCLALGWAVGLPAVMKL